MVLLDVSVCGDCCTGSDSSFDLFLQSWICWTLCPVALSVSIRWKTSSLTVVTDPSTKLGHSPNSYAIHPVCSVEHRASSFRMNQSVGSTSVDELILEVTNVHVPDTTKHFSWIIRAQISRHIVTLVRCDQGPTDARQPLTKVEEIPVTNTSRPVIVT